MVGASYLQSMFRHEQEKDMKMKLFASVVFATGLMVSTNASAQIFGGLDNNSLIGATLGGVLGSQLAGSGARTEGSAIGAVLGGLAGSALSSNRSNYYGGYVPAYGRGFGGYGSSWGNDGLVGAGIGATLGGVLGSQLAGTGARTEGSAIGAVLGGLAGYGIANKGFGRSSRYGSSAPVSYGTFGGYPASAPMPVMGQAMGAPIIGSGVQYIQGPAYVSSYSNYSVPQTSYTYSAPAPTVQHVYRPAKVITNKVIHHQPIVNRTIHITKPEYRSEVKYVQAPATYSAPTTSYSAPVTTYTAPTTPAVTYQPSEVLCYAGSSKRYDAYGNLISSGQAGYGYKSNRNCN